MPECAYHNCHKVGEYRLGSIWNGEPEDKRWENPTYLCKKHAKKIMEELGLDIKEIK